MAGKYLNHKKVYGTHVEKIMHNRRASDRFRLGVMLNDSEKEDEAATTTDKEYEDEADEEDEAATADEE
ncbi:hypothetical protein QVD17_02757 [Tagetes erecta]|uniref:Uncharacterized protein n=1 Tax=Tagetes erecta TaxID=13708 RepID=A0AAD8LC92_TARER|nr:hypothetical protein QVD17_02757 [Tagetes erecta]